MLTDFMSVCGLDDTLERSHYSQLLAGIVKCGAFDALTTLRSVIKACRIFEHRQTMVVSAEKKTSRHHRIMAQKSRQYRRRRQGHVISSWATRVWQERSKCRSLHSGISLPYRSSWRLQSGCREKLRHELEEFNVECFQSC
jgi:hypothetical protein